MHEDNLKHYRYPILQIDTLMTDVIPSSTLFFLTKLNYNVKFGILACSLLWIHPIAWRVFLEIFCCILFYGCAAHAFSHFKIQKFLIYLCFKCFVIHIIIHKSLFARSLKEIAKSKGNKLSEYLIAVFIYFPEKFIRSECYFLMSLTV